MHKEKKIIMRFPGEMTHIHDFCFSSCDHVLTDMVISVNVHICGFDKKTVEVTKV